MPDIDSDTAELDFSDRYTTIRKLLTNSVLSEVISRNDGISRVEGEGDIQFIRRIVATYLAIVDSEEE